MKGIRLTVSTLIRPTLESDLASLVQVVNLAYTGEYWLIPGPRLRSVESLQKEFRRPGNHFLVADQGGQCAGSIRLSVGEASPVPGAAYFGMLAVHPAFQSKGVGALLMSAAEALAASFGHDALWLDCAEEMGLVPYYAARGFRVASRVFDCHLGSTEPFTLVRMVKPIA